MIFKRKPKMKILFPSFNTLFVIPIVLLFVIRTYCEQIDDWQGHRISNNSHPVAKYELDPADLLPSGVDLDKLVFIVDNYQNRPNQPIEDTNQSIDDEDDGDEFSSLVSPNAKTSLPLKSSSTDDYQIQAYNQLPSISFENVFGNYLTRQSKINSDDLLNGQAFSNYYPDLDPISLVNNFRKVIPTLKLDKNSQDQVTHQLNQKLKQHVNDQINQEISRQQNAQSFNTITQLDSKISLNDILDKLNVLMGSNFGYMRRRQRRLIRNNPGLLIALYQGIKLSLSECKYQFKDHYWNCPTNKKVKGREMFGKILNRACRETAYLTAIRSAGITFAIAKGCSEGLIRTCSCDYRQNVNYISDTPGKSLFSTNSQYSLPSTNYPNELALRLGVEGIGGNAIGNVRQQEYTSDFKWSGCSDNIKFAFKKAKLLLDYHLKDTASSTQDKIMIHNYQTGRLAVKENMILVCKCHGVSGTCTMRTCWRRLSSFRKIGNYLKDQYNTAVQVMPTNDGESLTPKEDNISPSNRDLFYSDSSPDFCTQNLQEGSSGTRGRQCDAATSSNANSCDQLCCGRGYRKEVKILRSNCNCRFQYCCEVKCDTCKKSVEIYECV